MKKFSRLKVGFTFVEGLRDVVQKIPLDRILLETDAPYFFRGIKNHAKQKFSHPGCVSIVAQQVANLRGIPVLKKFLTTHNWKNAQEVYKLEQSPDSPPTKSVVKKEEIVVFQE